MPTIRNNAKPTPQTDDKNIFPLAIYEAEDGHSGENADRTWSKNLFARSDRLLHQMGRGRSVSPSQRH